MESDTRQRPGRRAGLGVIWKLPGPLQGLDRSLGVGYVRVVAQTIRPMPCGCLPQEEPNVAVLDVSRWSSGWGVTGSNCRTDIAPHSPSPAIPCTLSSLSRRRD